MNLPSKNSLTQVYGESEKSSLRFKKLSEAFAVNFGHETAEYFSSPGRTEIIGNHTDHNGGKVIAASINMDTIAAALPNGSDIIHIISKGYEEEIIIDLKNLPKDHSESAGLSDESKAASSYNRQTTSALVTGICEAALKSGFMVSGFDAYVTTSVISAAGVSSSASFEMLICSIINYFFNENSMDCTDYARIGQYAENVYWNKASGLLDQMACAVGGPILLDFSDKNNIYCKKINLSFEKYGYNLILVNT